MKLKSKPDDLEQGQIRPSLNPDPPSGGAVLASRLQNPALSNDNVKSDDFTWAAVLACISTVIFIALLIMQWLDWQALKIA